MGRWICISFFIIGLLLCGGCLPHADQPLTTPEEQEIDKRIIGSWYWQTENDDPGYVHIGRTKKGDQLQVLMIGIEEDGDLEMMEWVGHTTIIDDLQFLNLKWVRPLDREGKVMPGYIFVKYVLKEDRMEISIMEDDPIKAAIQNGHLAGKVEDKEFMPDIHITADAKTLRAFFVRHHTELFKVFKVFKRLHRVPEPAS